MAVIDLQAFRECEAQGLITGRTHPTHDLIIWNYTPKCQFGNDWNDVTMQARGLVTKPDGTIVARPFRKFMNIEQHEGPLPLEPFKVTEKADGSLGISYRIDGKTYIATRGSFTSEQAKRATDILHSKYVDFLPFFQQTHYYTYLFEIIYPENRICVDYGNMEDLVLLAVIKTETGEEYDIHDEVWCNLWPFPVIKHYDGIKDISILKSLEEPNREGFVIRFESGLRLKCKFTDYVRLHRLITQVNARVIWDLLRNNQPFDDLLEKVPDEFFSWVSTTRDTFLAQFTEIEQYCQQIVAQVQDLPTRKDQAQIIVKEQYSGVIFQMLDKKDYSEAIWKWLKPQAERPFREDES
jgi:putative RNA ligase